MAHNWIRTLCRNGQYTVYCTACRAEWLVGADRHAARRWANGHNREAHAGTLARWNILA